MYKILDKIEKMLRHEDITGYKVTINTEEKNYYIDKPEVIKEKANTYAVGFQVKSKVEEENE